MLNGESLDVELWRGNLDTLDTLAHIPGDGYWASGFHRCTVLLEQVAEFCYDVRGCQGLLGWLGSGVGSEQLLQVR